MSNVLRTALGVAMLCAALNAQAVIVTSNADPGDGNCDSDCTLREAIPFAQDGDPITFIMPFPQTISLQTALPTITGSITINGPGANLLTVRRDPAAATNFRVFTVAADFTKSAAISDMTIAGGKVGDGESGGGISVSGQVPLNLSGVHVTGNTAGIGGGVSVGFANNTFTKCTFSNNTATNIDGSGGGIHYMGVGGRTLRIVNSTISGNHSSGNGGGISMLSIGGSPGSSSVEITDSTIANNTAVGAGGILTSTLSGATGTTTFHNSIVANNTPANLATQAISGGGLPSFQSLGFNLSNNYNGVLVPLASDITANPQLGALADNGGPTPTRAPFAGSPALDRGNSSGSITDQRGLARPTDLPGIANAVGGDGSDIGAFEAQTETDVLFADGFEG